MSRATKCDSYKEEQIRPGYKNITIEVGERDVLGKHYISMWRRASFAGGSVWRNGRQAGRLVARTQEWVTGHFRLKAGAHRCCCCALPVNTLAASSSLQWRRMGQPGSSRVFRDRWSCNVCVIRVAVTLWALLLTIRAIAICIVYIF